MIIPLHERRWLSLELASFLGDTDRGRFSTAAYDRFYREASRQPKPIRAGWASYKKDVARWIEEACFRPFSGKPASDLRILSLGVGSGLVESRWLAAGYRVDLQECQPHSLAPLAARYPEARIYIGDARRLDIPDGHYDVVVHVALDYVFDRADYMALTEEAARLLSPGGRCIVYSVSNLTPRLLLAHVYRTSTGQRPKGVHWGWARSVGEHLAASRRCGLLAERVHWIRRRLSASEGGVIPVLSLPPLSLFSQWAPTADIAVVFQKKTRT